MKIGIQCLPLCFFLLSLTQSGLADWKQQIKDASLKYADDRKNEMVESASKTAIVELYKKLYPNLKNKSEREALRQLGELGMNASRLNSLASDLASGDPNKVQSASEALAVDFGKKLSNYIKTDPYMRQQMQSYLGSADKITEISKHLGSMAGGDPQPLYEYAGDLVIQAAGGANIVGFYRTAHGVMKFAKDAYVDSEIEGLYRSYRDGKLDPMQMDLAGTHYALRDKIIAERQQKMADLGSVDITDELRAHLTQVDEEDFKKRLLEGFEARKQKEEKAREQEAYAKQAEARAEAILSQLDDVASRKFGRNWSEEKQFNLEKYLEIIHEKTKQDPAFNADDSRDLSLMSRLLSTKMIYGVDSPEYEQALKNFNQIRNIRTGQPMEEEPDSPGGMEHLSGTLSGNWTGVYAQYDIKVGGVFRFQIDSAGNISGSFSGDDSGTLSGRMNASGNMDVRTGGGKAGTSSWSGTISRDSQGQLTGRGNWSSPGYRGTWQGNGR